MNVMRQVIPKIRAGKSCSMLFAELFPQRRSYMKYIVTINLFKIMIFLKTLIAFSLIKVLIFFGLSLLVVSALYDDENLFTVNSVIRVWNE